MKSGGRFSKHDYFSRLLGRANLPTVFSDSPNRGCGEASGFDWSGPTSGPCQAAERIVTGGERKKKK